MVEKLEKFPPQLGGRLLRGNPSRFCDIPLAPE